MRDRNEYNFVPALGFKCLTPIYDPVVRLTTRESVFKSELLKQSDLRRGQNVLDLACGTGTLTIALKNSCSEATITGLDGDFEILRIAQSKASSSESQIRFVCGRTENLPFPDGSFDRVVSSLFFHHLTSDAKIRTLEEVRRVLKPGGQLHIADWGKPANLVMSLASFVIQILDGFEVTKDNLRGNLPGIIQGAGFSEIVESSSLNTVFGTIRLLSAKREFQDIFAVASP